MCKPAPHKADFVIPPLKRSQANAVHGVADASSGWLSEERLLQQGPAAVCVVALWGGGGGGCDCIAQVESEWAQ